MNKELKDKIALFRIIHCVNFCYITDRGELLPEQPMNFTGKCIRNWDNGNQRYERNFLNGNFHGKGLMWRKNGDLDYEDEYINGELIEQRTY